MQLAVPVESHHGRKVSIAIAIAIDIAVQGQSHVIGLDDKATMCARRGRSLRSLSCEFVATNGFVKDD